MSINKKNSQLKLVLKSWKKVNKLDGWYFGPLVAIYQKPNDDNMRWMGQNSSPTKSLHSVDCATLCSKSEVMLLCAPTNRHSLVRYLSSVKSAGIIYKFHSISTPANAILPRRFNFYQVQCDIESDWINKHENLTRFCR